MGKKRKHVELMKEGEFRSNPFFSSIHDAIGARQSNFRFTFVHDDDLVDVTGRMTRNLEVVKKSNSAITYLVPVMADGEPAFKVFYPLRPVKTGKRNLLSIFLKDGIYNRQSPTGWVSPHTLYGENSLNEEYIKKFKMYNEVVADAVERWDESIGNQVCSYEDFKWLHLWFCGGHHHTNNDLYKIKWTPGHGKCELNDMFNRIRWTSKDGEEIKLFIYKEICEKKKFYIAPPGFNTYWKDCPPMFFVITRISYIKSIYDYERRNKKPTKLFPIGDLMRITDMYKHDLDSNEEEEIWTSLDQTIIGNCI